MLYVTTRNNSDTFTAYHALTENRAADGGHYVPFQSLKFSENEITALAETPFNQIVADILNRLFQTQLSKWDVDFAAGRCPVRLNSMSHKITVAESWHNLDWEFSRMVKNLTAQIRGTRDTEVEFTDWTAMAVRIAVLFGVVGELKKQGIGMPVDIAVASSDFSMVMSAFYARQWGLPIGNIICCCNENKQVWDLLCNGQMRTDEIPLSTTVPEADVALPANLERLICACGGVSEVQRYLDCCTNGNAYSVSDPMLQKLRNGLYVSVVSSDRVETTIPNVFKTHQYVLSPASALAYSGLLDYRSKTGITRPAIFLSDKSPACDAGFVAEAMNLSQAELKKLI